MAYQHFVQSVQGQQSVRLFFVARFFPVHYFNKTSQSCKNFGAFKFVPVEETNHIRNGSIVLLQGRTRLVTYRTLRDGQKRLALVVTDVLTLFWSTVMKGDLPETIESLSNKKEKRLSVTNVTGDYLHGWS